jgi:hypothetical protein
MSGSTTVLQPFDNPCASLIQLCDCIDAELTALGRRARARRAKDQEAYRATLTSVVAGVATIALARVSPRLGFAVSFDERAYRGGTLSVTQLRAIRDGLKAAGLAQVVGGYHDRESRRRSAITRLLPTSKLNEMIRKSGVVAADVVRPPTELTTVNEPVPGLGPAPADAAEGERALKAANSLNSRHVLTLPEDAWDRVKVLLRQKSVRGEAVPFGCNEAAIYLTRKFKHDWDRGGRLYGGFWQNLPKQERRHLTIDGEATLELDFVSLHPTMLYAAAGHTMEGDPYIVPGFEGVPREVGKETFNRLLNGTWSPHKAHPLTFTGRAKDHFKDRESFRSYVQAMRTNHALISHYLGTGRGILLQKQDGDLAIMIIRRCIDANIPVFPIHDSFIVRATDAPFLFQVMKEEAEVAGIIGVRIRPDRGSLSSCL